MKTSVAPVPLVRVDLRGEPQLVAARKRAREIAELVGFDRQDQVRIATIVSEIARNALRYAGGGAVEFRLRVAEPRACLEIEVADQGGGIADLQAVLDGRYRSGTGMGMGLIGARRLMDEFDVESSGRGTRVRLGKFLPRVLSETPAATASRVGRALARNAPSDPESEFAEQNRELLATLAELQRRQAELVALNQEIGETNRGVVALYAELDDRAREVQRIADVKSRFLSNITHEFRTPLNAILSLSRLLLEEVDGPLAAEQEKQIRFIHKAARDLVDLTNDLLDLAKMDSGKIELQIAPVDVGELFAALRGMLKPTLAAGSAVALVFEGAEGLPPVASDERKLAQILRNLLSNALKYTERGEVRVSARVAGDRLRVAVADTGVGIAEEHRERVFEEFYQVEGPHQRRAKGTGLGLPLARKFAELLGGSLTLRSAPGRGSEFTLDLPLAAPPPHAEDGASAAKLVLIVHPDAAELVALGSLLAGDEFRPVYARGFSEGLEVVRRVRPAALVVHDPADALLAARAAGQGPAPRVILVSDRPPAEAAGVHAVCDPAEARVRLAAILRGPGAATPEVLIVDDEEPIRYVLQKVVGALGFSARAAKGGREALAAAVERRPDLVILDLVMPDLGGAEVLRALKADARTAGVPVVVYSARAPRGEEAGLIGRHAFAVVDKGDDDFGRLAAAIRSALPRASGLAEKGGGA